ncbi:MAG TPA: metallophosphoesterase [Bacteroidales bacterium]|nr:metallophosphoesterase [Bacteroidales bacterium]
MIITRKIIYFLLPLFLLQTSRLSGQFSFVHISDIHVSNEAPLVGNIDSNGIIFSQMLSNIYALNPKPAFVVASGDLSNEGSNGDGMYPLLTQYLFPSPISNPANGDYFIDPAATIPIYFVPGNHDYYSSLVPPLSDPALDAYASQVGPASDYFITYNNAVIIFMFSGYNQFRPVWVDWDVDNIEGSGLTIDQCGWLRNVMAGNPGKKKIIIMHHPPVNAIGTNADGSPSTTSLIDAEDGSIINNRSVFLDICDSNSVDVILAGHVHQNVVANRAGAVVDENWAGGVRYAQTAACMYGGYRIITVDSSFVWLGLPQHISPVSISENNPSNDHPVIGYDPLQKMINVNLAVKNSSVAELFLYSISGQLLSQKCLNDNQLCISTAGLSEGLYIIKIRCQTFSYTEKVAIY